MINAVMLGAIAGARALPISADAFEAAIRADGKAVDANLRGFRAGFAAAAAGSRLPQQSAKRQHAASPTVADLEAEIAGMPLAAHTVTTEGVRGFTWIGSSRFAMPISKPRAVAGCWLQRPVNWHCGCPTRTLSA
jgi:indolepyruvate ferredoxin oxidoreductase beta subunit